MKTTFTLRFTLAAVLCLFLQFSKAEATSKTVHVETAGTLSALITEMDKYQITELTISGDLNGTDIRYIREMAGANVYGKPTEGKLATLDMSGANIVEGGSSYFAEDYDNGWLTGATYHTSDNEIGSFIFTKCKSLINLILPNSVTRIGDYYVFTDCENIESIVIGNNVTYIGHFAFQHCGGLKKLIIPDSVTDMGTCPLGGCSGMTEIYLGKGVKEVPYGSHLGIPGWMNVEKIIISEENPYISSIDGVLFNKDMTTLIACSPGRKSSSYTVPESVTKIQDGAFIYCSNLTSITIHKNLTDISDGDVFGQCTALAEIHNNNPIPQHAAPLHFYGVDQSACILYVPVGSVELYKNAPGWEDFVNIREEIPLSINPNDQDNISIGSISGGIRINTIEKTTVSIFNVSGQNVYESVLNGTTDIKLNKGVYIVKIDNESRKVIVK